MRHATLIYIYIYIFLFFLFNQTDFSAHSDNINGVSYDLSKANICLFIVSS